VAAVRFFSEQGASAAFLDEVVWHDRCLGTFINRRCWELTGKKSSGRVCKHPNMLLLRDRVFYLCCWLCWSWLAVARPASGSVGSQLAGRGNDWKPYDHPHHHPPPPPPPPPPPDHCHDHHHHHDNSSETPNFTFEELWDLQNTFLTQFMYPNNAKQAESINSTLFDPNVPETNQQLISSRANVHLDQGPRRHH